TEVGQGQEYLGRERHHAPERAIARGGGGGAQRRQRGRRRIGERQRGLVVERRPGGSAVEGACELALDRSEWSWHPVSPSSRRRWARSRRSRASRPAERTDIC